MFNDPAMEAGGTAITDLVTHISIHTAGTVASSSDESAAGREAITWTVDTDGTVTAGPIPFTGGASGGPAVRVGYWGASSGGTYYGGAMLSGDTTFSAAGEYTVTEITETASSS